MDKEQRQRDREDAQLARLTRQKAKGRYAGYFAVLILVIMAVDILDNMTTGISTNITSCFITEFFVNGKVFGKSYEYEAGLALHGTINLLGYVIALLTPFYKSLGDKIGRKPLFAMSSLGMAVGLLIIYFCKTYFVFMIGNFMLSFFLGHDIQILYVLEEAPSKHRAKIYSALKAIGGFSNVLIPLMRDKLMGNDATLWRNVYILPGICGLGAVVLVLLFAKETRVFIDERIEYLSRPYEERKAEHEAARAARLAAKAEHKKTESEAQSGIVPAIRYIFSHKELFTLVAIKTLFDAAIIAMTTYESIMYKAGMTEVEITRAEYFFPFIYGASVLISGFLADKIGRKKTILIFGSICALAFVSFIMTTNRLMAPEIVGAMYGLYLGGYWIGRDYMEIMSTEMVPTGIRASIIGAEGLLVYIGMGIGYAAVYIGMLFIPIWLICLIFALPCIVISVILLLFKVKETAGVDYEAL